MANKCPNCGEKINTSPFMIQNTTVRCKCGTRVTVAPGLFKDSIVDWETPKERPPQTIKGATIFCTKCGQELPEDSNYCNKCGAKLPT